MKATIEDFPNVPPKDHTLLHSPHYAAQLAGSSLFFQVMTGLRENPVKIILHDRFSGERKLLTIETSEKLVKPAESHVAQKAVVGEMKQAPKQFVKPPTKVPQDVGFKLVTISVPESPSEVKKSPLSVSSPATPVARTPSPSLSPSPSPKVSPTIKTPSPDSSSGEVFARGKETLGMVIDRGLQVSPRSPSLSSPNPAVSPTVSTSPRLIVTTIKG
jgi:hypothetical protein